MLSSDILKCNHITLRDKVDNLMQLMFERTKHLTGSRKSWRLTYNRSFVWQYAEYHALLYTPKIRKVKSVKMFPVHAMKAKRWNRGIAPLILYLDTRWSVHHPSDIISPGIKPCTHWTRRWVCPRSRQDVLKKNAPARFETRNAQAVTQSINDIPDRT